MSKQSAQKIVEIIMTQHWDMAACNCWICVKGRAAGCSPMGKYLAHHVSEPLGRVEVGTVYNTAESK